MNPILRTAILAGLLASPSFAIFGIGGHFTTNTGSLSSSHEYAVGTESMGGIQLHQGSMDGMIGLGGKFWIDFLPFVDIETNLNLQWGRYDAALGINAPGGSELARHDISVKFDGIPLGRQKPVYSQIVGDLSVTYPFLKLPPAISILRLYAGGGLSYFASTPVLDRQFASELLASTSMEDLLSNPNVGATLANTLAEQLAEDGLNMGFGGHLMAGMRAKLPVIPIAAYCNGKYYFGGNQHSAFSPGFVLELGGGIAF